MSETYCVIVTREEGWWLASVESITGTVTEARTLASLDSRAREIIALAEDLPVGAERDLRVTWDFRTGDADVDTLAASLRAERRRLAEAEGALAERTADLARRLRQRWSVRDVATLLGVSPQRISQIAPDPRPVRRGRKSRAA